MKRALLHALLACCAGCTVNVYWTDSVVYGELRQGSDVVPTREPIPLEVLRK